MKQPNTIVLLAFIFVSFVLALGGFWYAVKMPDISTVAAVGILFGIASGGVIAGMVMYAVNILIDNMIDLYKNK